MAGTRDDGLRGTRFNALNAYLFRLWYYYTCNNLFIGILDYIFSFIKISKVNLEIGLRNSKFEEYLNNNTMRKLLLEERYKKNFLNEIL